MNSPDSSISNSKRPERHLGWLYVLLSIFAVFVFLWFVVMPQFSEAYMAAMRDKIDRAESIDEPKIMLIGNSNVAYGFESAMLEEAMGMPVVNMGMSAAFGVDFNERMAKVNLNPGDIVVVAHNDYIGDSRVESATIVWMTMENYLPVWQLLEPQDFPRMFETFPAYIGMAIKRWINEYNNDWAGEIDRDNSRFAYNEYGDIATNRPGNAVELKNLVVGFRPISPERIKRLNELNQYVTERGARMVVTARPYAMGEYSLPPSALIKFYQELEGMLDCPMIGDLKEQFYDYSLFYNHDVHLTNAGARLRTQQLITDLTRWLHPEKVAPLEKPTASDVIYIHGVNPNLLTDTDGELRPVDMTTGLVSDWSNWGELGLQDGETVTLSAFLAPQAEGDKLTLHMSTAAVPGEVAETFTSDEIEFDGKKDFVLITFVYDQSKPYVCLTLTGENENQLPVTAASFKQLKLERGEWRTGYYSTALLTDLD